MRQNDIYDACNYVDVFNGNVAGSVNRRPCRDNCNTCGGVLGDNTQNRPPMPPYPHCPPCPPGTHPCKPFYPSCNRPSLDNTIAASFYNTTAQTIAPGALIPYAYVTGTNVLGSNTPTPTNGTVMLDCGLYLMSYSVNGINSLADQTITALPEYQGTAHSEYARTQTIATAGDYFNLSNTFLALITSPTTLDIKLNITTDPATSVTAVTDVSASLTLVKLSDLNDLRPQWQNNCNCR